MRVVWLQQGETMLSVGAGGDLERQSESLLGLAVAWSFFSLGKKASERTHDTENISGVNLFPFNMHTEPRSVLVLKLFHLLYLTFYSPPSCFFSCLFS